MEGVAMISPGGCAVGAMLLWFDSILCLSARAAMADVHGTISTAAANPFGGGFGADDIASGRSTHDGYERCLRLAMNTQHCPYVLTIQARTCL